MVQYDEPGIACKIFVPRYMSPGGPGCDGGGEAVGNNVGGFYVIVCIRPEE